jgi:tetratricopeptide (TPR) repeat protein
MWTPLHLIGVIALQRGWHPIALAFIDQALIHDPDFADAHLNRANVLKALGQPHDALTALERVVELEPAYAEAWSNRGNLLKDMGRLDEAMASYDRALALDPAQPDASWNKAWALLLTGDLAAGWPLHEFRWQASGRAPPSMTSQSGGARPILRARSSCWRASRGLAMSCSSAAMSPCWRPGAPGCCWRSKPPCATLWPALRAWAP